MAIMMKCKMCGGDLTLTEGSTIATCEYCGTTQTVPSQDSEKKLALFARANQHRADCEFDKAAGVYETIIGDFPAEAEAYWGLVLCKYGIEYVDDPATGKKVPTCHRSSFDSVLEDDNFEQAMENADAISRRVYREEAKAIEELRRGIVEVSSKEEPYDIFICYKETAEDGNRTLDSVLAQDIYDALTERGYRVFFSRITLEDKLGQEYEPYIFAALHSAKIMLAVGTDYEYYNAVWVKNEWSRFLSLIASGEKKTLIPCYKNLDAYDMPKGFAKLQAQDLGKVGAIQDLLRGVEKILPLQKMEPLPQPVVATPAAASVDSLLKRGYMALEDGNWKKADEFFDRVLDADPENAEAYIGKTCADYGVKKLAEVAHQPLEKIEKILQSANFKRAQQFARGEFSEKLLVATQAAEAVLIADQQARVNAIKQEEDKKAREFQRLADIRQKNKAAQRRITEGLCGLYALKSDGTVLSSSRKDLREASTWENIVEISTRWFHIVGLKADGTVVATGKNNDGRCDVSQWNHITSVAAGDCHSVGLKEDGSVVAVGSNKHGQCNVTGWTDIKEIAAGSECTVGLKKDGKVVVATDNAIVPVKILFWENIVSISVSSSHIVGLKADGTVVAEFIVSSPMDNGECNVGSWTDVVAIAAYRSRTFGLKSDGKVVAVGFNGAGACNVERWTDVVAILANGVGLKSNGTLVLAGNWNLDLSGWKLFESVDTLEQECAEAPARRQKEHIAALESERAALQTELTNLKGFFSRSRRTEIEGRLLEISIELGTMGL